MITITDDGPDATQHVVQQQAFAKLEKIITTWDATVAISSSSTFPDGGFFLHFQHYVEIETEYLPEELEAEGEDLPAAIDALKDEIDAYEPKREEDAESEDE